MNLQPLLCIRVLLVGAAALLAPMALSQEQHPAAPPPPPNAKKVQCKERPVPQLEDVTEKAGIRFRHIANPLSTYIVESMSGGVILWDYDRDGWLDIYFTNAPTIEMALRKESARGALYHNNHNGTFSDATDKSGLAAPCFAMGGAVADYNNDGWPDLYLTCLGGNVLFRNNGDGTFTDVTAKAGVADGRMSVGAAFGDYDRDGFVDLMVTNYVDFQLDHLPPFGGKSLCKYRGIDVYCGPRGLKGAGDSLFHNNGDGTFTDVSKAAGLDDPHGYYGLGVVWADFVDEEVPSINGKSWPYTERMSYQVGETTHWRFLNPTWTDHALHLHGFYFKVDGVGDGDHYERYAEEQQPTAVTEHIDPGHVFELTWTPDRAGNWLVHCHMADHMSPPKYRMHDPRAMSEPAHRNDLGMGGLVLGITVRGSERAVPSPPVAARKLRLVISENPSKVPLYQLSVNDPELTVKPDSNTPTTTLLGPPIVLRRGEATEIDVRNECTRPTSIHWHGMEIESYYDGVAGWTGTSDHPSPAILPGTSFVARMTPPRAGTFIYHTHWHDDVQLVNGVYGPLIVLEKGEQYDPEHDRAFVFSAGKYPPFGFILLVNGHPEPDPVKLKTATRYRLRLINITQNEADLRVRLLNNGAPVRWKVIAKDGASLPPAQLKLSTADLGITVGETYDVEYQADTAGLADLEIRETGFPTPVTLPLTFSDAK